MSSTNVLPLICNGRTRSEGNARLDLIQSPYTAYILRVTHVKLHSSSVAPYLVETTGTLDKRKHGAGNAPICTNSGSVDVNHGAQLDNEVDHRVTTNA